MQANDITLSVDTLNTGTTTDENYTRHSEELNKTTYVGPNHSADMRKIMTLHRSVAKPSGVSRGMQRSTVKFTTDVSVPNADGSGEIVLPLIVEAAFTIPVGCTAAETLEMRQRVVAVLDDDDVMAPLNDILEI